MFIGAISADSRLLDCEAVINDGEVAIEGAEIATEGAWLFLRLIRVKVGFANRRGATMNHWQQPPHAIMNQAVM
jgi:hypothetical protein